MKKVMLVFLLLSTQAHAYDVNSWEVSKKNGSWSASGYHIDSITMESDGFTLYADSDLELSGKCSASQSSGLRAAGLSISYTCYDHAVQVHFYEQGLRGKTPISPSEIDSGLGPITVKMYGPEYQSVQPASSGVHCPNGYYAVQSGQGYKCVKKTTPHVSKHEPSGNRDD